MQTETLTQQITALHQGTVSASFLAERALQRARSLESLNAFVALEPAHILAQAKAADERRKRRALVVDIAPRRQTKVSSGALSQGADGSAGAAMLGQ